MNYFAEYYYAQLDSPEWKSFRKAFIERRSGRCELCGKSGRGLQVHHKCYRLNLRAWDYPDSDLMFLCYDCHRQLHADLLASGRKIPVYEGDGYEPRIPDAMCCTWCGGKGRKDDYPYLLGGICFKCFGTGLRYVHKYTPEEAWRYGRKIYSQWYHHHERLLRYYDIPRFNDARDVRDWLMGFNRSQ